MQQFHTLKGTTGKARIEEYLGRTWTVVPVVALVEGVIHASNAANPELVKYEVLSKQPLAWNGRPVFIGHPVNAAGRPVPGNTPETLEALGFGQVFNAAITNKKLTMEAWLDNDRASVVPNGQDLLDRIASEEPIEVSVGVFTETTDETGEYNGKEYVGTWEDIAPEHLALLVEGDVGACSREMGCGVRAASQNKETVMSKTSERKGILGRVLAMFRTAQDPESMSDNDVRTKIYNALKENGVGNAYVEAVYDADFVYCVYNYETYAAYKYYRRAFSVNENGQVTLGGDVNEVEPVLSYEAVGGAEVKAAAAAPTGACSCHATRNASTPAGEEKNMKREDVLKRLETATDAQLETIGKVFEPAAEVVAPQVAAPVAAEPVVASAKTTEPTFEALLAAAKPEVRESIEAGIRTASERKAATIKALKDSGRCTFSDADLNGFSQAQLDALKTLAGVQQVTAAVDFSGMGVARTPSQGAMQEAPDAPDFVAAIQASQKK